jgi:dTDP-4-dehydrorhamnose 3,5-epimerase
LVQVLHGKAIDIAVDIRRSSPTFKQWVAVELSDENGRLFFIPPGFAHGFVALTDEVKFHYKCTEEYDQPSERGIRWDDPAIAIEWPGSFDFIVSAKDQALPLLADAPLFD